MVIKAIIRTSYSFLGCYEALNGDKQLQRTLQRLSQEDASVASIHRIAANKRSRKLTGSGIRRRAGLLTSSNTGTDTAVLLAQSVWRRIPMKPKETEYKGCRFRSRLEARWAVFFDALGLKWWYEPEGFDLHVDYEEFAKGWDFTEEELVAEGIPQVFKALDGKKYSYLPELNYWIEIKGPNPTKAELLKAFFLSTFVHDAARAKLHEAATDKDQEKAWNDLINGGVYVFYGDIPWPYPERGNAVGYGVGGATSGGTVFGPERLYAWLGLCWQQCRLCLKIGIDSLGATYCRGCKFELEKTIYSRSRMTEAIGQELADVKREGRLLDELDDLVKDLPPEDRSSTLEALPLFSNDSEKRVIRETLKKHDRLVQEALNLDFFTTGHKTPDLQVAYTAARSARFEGRRLL